MRDQVGERFFVPCGKCIGCRQDYARDWSTRLMCEYKTSSSAYFLTLTYNDQHLPSSPSGVPTLVKSDFQKFMKRLRLRYSDDNLRYFACGEYGSKTLRPHYHVILFNWHPGVLNPFGRNELGQTTFRCSGLDDCWSDYLGNDGYNQAIYDPLGYTLVGSCTKNSISYVARYVNKKMSGLPDEYFSALGAEKPFTLMSRNPGIGFQFLDEHPELFDSSSFNVDLDGDVTRCFVPKKFYERLEIVDPVRYNQLKEQRSLSASLKYDSLSDNGNRHTYLRRLRASEDNKAAVLKKLKRSLD